MPTDAKKIKKVGGEPCYIAQRLNRAATVFINPQKVGSGAPVATVASCSIDCLRWHTLKGHKAVNHMKFKFIKY